MRGVGSKLLVLEDRDYLRASMCEVFADRGFSVVGVGSRADAEAKFWQEPDAFCVLILDMHLQEPATGADFGIEVRKRLGNRSPEFLIQSGYNKPEYFQLAFSLGAASYLLKADQQGPENLIRHVRSLAIRRSLRVDRSGLPEEIRRIVSLSKSEEDAVDGFCSEILLPCFIDFLGTGFVLFVSDRNGSRCFSSKLNKVVRSERYGDFQERIFANLASVGMQINQLLPINKPEPDPVFQDLIFHPGTVFLPLASYHDLRLSLGLIQETPEERPLAEDVGELAKVLMQYLQPALLSNLLEITRSWTESDLKRRRLGDACNYCLYVGQEVSILFDEAVEAGGVDHSEKFAPLWRLRDLGAELRTAGELLAPLSVSLEHERTAERKELAARSLIENAWSRLNEEGRASDKDVLRLRGDCVVLGREDFFRICVERVLLWLVGREKIIAEEQDKGIFVDLDSERGELCFEDRSPRLSRGLRDELFAPFSTPIYEPMPGKKDPGRYLGLYLAKALIEAQGGRLEERSDELPGEKGHRFVICMPGLAGVSAALKEKRGEQ